MLNIIPFIFALFFFSAMKPFWDGRGQNIQIKARLNALYVCEADNRYIFRKNRTGACYPLQNLSQTLQAIAAAKNKTMLKLVFANTQKKYLKPSVVINNNHYAINNILYYSRSAIVYLEMTKKNKYYFLRIPVSDLGFE